LAKGNFVVKKASSIILWPVFALDYYVEEFPTLFPFLPGFFSVQFVAGGHPVAGGAVGCERIGKGAYKNQHANHSTYTRRQRHGGISLGRFVAINGWWPLF
jgi:hypothetical protein